MNIKRLTTLALLSSMLAVSTLITIPAWFQVPFTLQTLMVSLIGLLLVPLESFLVVLVYLAVGAIGLPVFSGFQGGFQHFLSPTGGFLISFPLASSLISLLKKDGRHLYNLIIINLVMIILVYIIGVGHFMIVTKNTLANTFILFLPFIFIDMGKNFISYFIYTKINPIVNR